MTAEKSPVRTAFLKYADPVYGGAFLGSLFSHWTTTVKVQDQMKFFGINEPTIERIPGLLPERLPKSRFWCLWSETSPWSREYVVYSGLYGDMEIWVNRKTTF